MSIPRCLAFLAGAAAIAACAHDSTASRPTDDAQKYAREFDSLASSIDSVGPNIVFDASAEAMRHIAAILRATGSATPVIVTIDGVTQQFLAVGEQLSTPVFACIGVTPPVPGPGDSTGGGGIVCDSSRTAWLVSRSVIAWDPDALRRIVRVVADTGSANANLARPDVMVSLPSHVAADSSGTPVDSTPPIPQLGFLGEYLVRGDSTPWWAISGTQHNALVAIGGACEVDSVHVDGATFSCERALLRFDFDMTVARSEIVPDSMSGRHVEPGDSTHTISMAPTDVTGVSLVFGSWNGNLRFPPTVTGRRIASHR
jgi:hypothetical protein